MKKLTVCTEFEGGTEALYADGVRVRQDDTIFAADIAHEAGDFPIQFEHRDVDSLEGEWQESLDDVPTE